LENTIQQGLQSYFSEQKRLSGSEYPELVEFLAAWVPNFDLGYSGTKATMQLAILFRAFLDRGRIMSATKDDNLVYFLRIPYGTKEVDLIVREKDSIEPIVVEVAGTSFPDAARTSFESFDEEVINANITYAKNQNLGSSTVTILDEVLVQRRRALIRVA